MPDDNDTRDTENQPQENSQNDQGAKPEQAVDRPEAEKTDGPDAGMRENGTASAKNPAIPDSSKPAFSETAGPVSQVVPTNPAQLVLQWLVYAFWGWSALAVSWLTFLVVQYFRNEEGAREAVSDMLPYSLASIIVLVLISLISDIFYARKEPTPKSGAAMVIMVIHAVIFALFAIGWLIAAVFGGIRILIGGWSVDSGALTLIISALIISVIYVATLLRTLRPTGRSGMVRGYWIFMVSIVAVLVIAGITGPAVHAGLRQQDQAIENGLPDVSRAINQYARDRKELPSSLDAVAAELKGDAKRIIEADKVRYTPKGELPSAVPANQNESDEPVANPTIYPPVTTDRQTFRYQLCVEYLTEKNENSYGDATYGRESDRVRYDVTPKTYSHDKGEECYELQTNYARILME